MILSRDYIINNLSAGVITVDLSSWEEFSNLVTGRLLNTGNYIWMVRSEGHWMVTGINFG